MRIAGFLGLIAMIALIAHEGASTVAQLLSQAGWILLLLVPLHAIPLMLDVIGWRTLLAPADTERRARLFTLFEIAAVREAVNRLLPVGNVGGEIVGTRLLVLRGIPVSRGGASIVVEVLLTLVAQYVFVVIGVLCLLRIAGTAQIVDNALLALVISLPIVVLLVVLLRYGSVFERLGRVMERLLGTRAHCVGIAEQSAQLDVEIMRLYRARARLAAALAWQVAGLCVGTLETWLALRWLGFPVSLATAVALESLTQAIRHFVFFVPAGLGVQEAGLIAIGSLLGVHSDAALALSLVKRAREILFGVPALLAWQWVEGRRLVWAAAQPGEVRR
jgi:putative membrane protein